MEDRKYNDSDQGNRNEIFGRQIKAGKRSYFVDVKATNGGDYYLVITESKKRMANDGKFVFAKNKVFLYKEDLDRFIETLNEAVQFIKREQPYDPAEYAERRRKYMEERNSGRDNYGNGGNDDSGGYKSNLNFEDL